MPASNDGHSLPLWWYRGVSASPDVGKRKATSNFAYYEGAKPDALKGPVSPEIETLYKKGAIERVYHFYPHDATGWKINKTYSGMSNFGFGIYFSNSLEWASRYGNYIYGCTVDPSVVFIIDWRERSVEGSAAYKLMEEVFRLGGNTMRDQSAVFSKAVKKFKKGAKALYVKVDDDEGQLVVFDTKIIRAHFLAEFYPTKTNPCKRKPRTMATKRKKMITFTSGIDIRSRSASKPTVAKFLTHLGPRYIVIGTPYGHVRTSGGDVRTWTTASGARKWIAANYPVTKSNPSRGTRWRMDDGSIVTTDQLKRKFFGKLPTPNQRRMLGICRVKTAKTKAAPRRRSR